MSPRRHPGCAPPWRGSREHALARSYHATWLRGCKSWSRSCFPTPSSTATAASPSRRCTCICVFRPASRWCTRTPRRPSTPPPGGRRHRPRWPESSWDAGASRWCWDWPRARATSAWPGATGSRSASLELLQVAQHLLVVAVGLDLRIDLADHALGIDQEGDAVPVFGALELRLAHAERSQELRPGVGQQRHRERELVAEALVRLHVVGGEAHHHRTDLVEGRLGGGEALALQRAARRVVLRVGVDHQPLALEVGQADGGAFLVGEGEDGERLAGLQHG